MKKALKKIQLKKKTISLLNGPDAMQMKGGNKPLTWTMQSVCNLCPSVDVPCDSQQVCDSVNFCAA